MVSLAERDAPGASNEPAENPRRTVGRNEPCPCGSGSKYKKCCLLHERPAAQREHGVELPRWILDAPRKLPQFIKYATQVYGLPRILGSLRDGRRDPTYSTVEVVTSLFFAGLLRRPSINAIEGELKQTEFQKLIGRKPKPDEKAFSAEVVSNVLDKLSLDGLRHGIEDVIWRAERNKVFREGSYGTLRIVALDAWETFCSYTRCCPHCLVRKVKRKNPDTDEVEEVEQYYHRCVVAMLVGPVLDVVLDLEPVLNAEARRDLGEDAHHEGELTAAHRLIDRLHETYGTFIDAFVCDALYANGPVMTKIDDYGYGGFIVLKKDDNEPLKEALALWRNEGPCQQLEDDDKKEHVEFWDVDDIDTLDSFDGKVRVIRTVTTKDNGTQKTWCFGVVGQRARKVGRKTAFQIIRSRWHIENTGFCQWVKYWNLGRVYHHTPNAILAILLLWMLVFNFLQFFVYRRLKRPRVPKDPCDTIIGIVAVIFRDVALIPERIPWEVLADAGFG